MLISLKDITSITPLRLNNAEIEYVTNFRLLGVMIGSHLKFDNHIEMVKSKARKKTHRLVVLKRYGVNAEGLPLYTSSIRPVLSYAAPAWYCYVSDKGIGNLEKVQKTHVPE